MVARGLTEAIKHSLSFTTSAEMRLLQDVLFLSFRLFHALLVLSTILLLNVLFASGLCTSILFPSTLVFLLFLTKYFTLSQFDHCFIIQFNLIFNTVK